MRWKIIDQCKKLRKFNQACTWIVFSIKSGMAKCDGHVNADEKRKCNSILK